MSGDPSVQGDGRFMLFESTCKVYIDSKGRFCGNIGVSSPVISGSVVIAACCKVLAVGSVVGEVPSCFVGRMPCETCC